MTELREEFETESTPMVISGCIGPRGDGYEPGRVMTAQEAQVYHAGQVDTFAATGADMVTAITMTNIPEAIAITHAARSAKVPVVISFTVETDGNLPTGDSLKDAIATVDAATDHGPAYYMIICAHPVHFASALGDDLLDVPVIGAAMKRMKPSTISLRCQPNLQFESAKPCRP